MVWGGGKTKLTVTKHNQTFPQPELVLLFFFIFSHNFLSNPLTVSDHYDQEHSIHHSLTHTAWLYPKDLCHLVVMWKCQWNASDYFTAIQRLGIIFLPQEDILIKVWCQKLLLSYIYSHLWLKALLAHSAANQNGAWNFFSYLIVTNFEWGTKRPPSPHPT